MKNVKISAGYVFISIVAVWAMGGSYIFDWNHTHIYNPHWPPHAKFHNAQTMLLGTCIGILALWILWRANITNLLKVQLAVVLSSFYWITQIGATLFPGTSLSDPEFSYPGELPHQLIVDIVMLILLIIGYWLKQRNLRKQTKGTLSSVS